MEREHLSLAQRFDPRSNSLSVLRLGLAALVAIVHASAVGWDRQPGIGKTSFGELAVDGFFVVSGFLVVRSALRLPTLRRYVWHRALRIMPGFWASLVVVAFVAAPLVAWLRGRSLAMVFSGPESAFGYVGATRPCSCGRTSPGWSRSTAWRTRPSTVRCGPFSMKLSVTALSLSWSWPCR
jgi:peptidoglycan/LPS O-acetylase OafA/YrhL